MLLERLAWASLWGTALALGVALLCRLFPKIPAAVRFWLWWAVPAKLLLGLVPALSLAVLPASPTVPVRSPAVPKRFSTVPAPFPAVPAPFPTVPARFSTIPMRSPAVPARSPAVPMRFSDIFLLFWLVGALFTLMRALSKIPSSRSLRGAQLGEGYLEAPGVGPLVRGLVRPVIVLPTGLSDSERRLALAHERAHIQRGDPWLALVPLAARVVFWFLPTISLVERALATAREEDCDFRARRATGASAREYGALLLKLTQAPTGTGSLAMASPAFSQLQSRLKTLALPQKRVPLWPLVLPGALVLPGWRLSERGRAPQSPPPLPVRYLRENLATLGGRYSDAFAITDSGQVLGATNGTDGKGRATLWQDGTPTPLSEQRSIAFAASELGEVAVTALKSGGHRRALWQSARGVQELFGLPGFPETVAVGMTAQGTLVGSALRPQGAGSRAVVWEAGVARELGTLGGAYSQASAVNASGWVVGKADLSATETHAFLYDGTRLRDLGTLGGRNSRATAINARGQVVGVSETASGERVAFLWSAETGMRALPGANGIALAINDQGTVVGQSDGHAALWSAEGTPIPLEPSLVVARGINQRGELVGQGWVGDDLRAFRLTPVPAP